MERKLRIGRRDFTERGLLLLLSGVAVTVSGCGGGGGYGGGTSMGPSGPSGPMVGAGDKVGSISGNHGHSAVVTAVQLSAGDAVNLDIRGTADHTHAVSLGADQIQAIAANQQVSMESTATDGHTHTVTFN